MSDKFQWVDEEEFRDQPDEVNQMDAPPVNLPNMPANMTREQLIQQVQSSGEVESDEEIDVSQFVGTSGDDEDEDYSEVLSDARLRLEQGRLYEMVMNHSLFEGTDADERAVKSVQRAIRKFAKEQMEVMLGMRQTVQAAPQLSSPFNELEIMLLKQLASKMSGGKTQEVEPEKYVAPAKKREGLKAISVQKTSAAAKPLPKTPQAPIKRTKAKPTPEELLGLPPEVEKPLGKHPSQMTPEERAKVVAERDKRIAERQKQLKSAKPQSALPQPTPDQEAMLATIRATEADSKGTVSAIMALLNAQKMS